MACQRLWQAGGRRAAGARVIKVERLGGGDFARSYDEVVKGQSTFFTWANRGKESVRINIMEPEGGNLFLRLIYQADVFFQNLSPSSLKKHGLDSSTFRSNNPRLITCDISGYGEESEYAGMRAYDNQVQD